MDKNIDRIILGHNQFFGVNHLSSGKGVEREQYFNKMENIMGLIDCARENGAGGMMLSTHPRAPMILDEIKNSSLSESEFGFYPLLPYIAKYIRSSNEKGLINVVLEMIGGTSIGDKFSLVVKGGKGVLTKDFLTLLKTLMDIELAPFNGLNVKAVFLHDVLTDLALGLDFPEVFHLYCDYISEKYNARPAFTTKNPGFLMEKLTAYGIENPLVMTHINKAGYMMNPSREACEKTLAEYNFEAVAMGSLASGYLKPPEAYEYLAGLPNVKSMVVGASTKSHIESTFDAIKLNFA